MRSALITGLAGPALTAAEARLLADSRPIGIILFSRNCVEHDQIRALVIDAKSAIGSGDVLVLIDQEGGRVQRLRPPLGRALPPAAAYAGIYRRDPALACRYAFEAAQLVAGDLLDLGINTDCAPVLDVPVEGSHDIIGDRAYGRDPVQVAMLGRAVAEGFLAGGVLPVIKHIPGHGRATKDSHHDLPVVTATRTDLSVTDFAAFKPLAAMPLAMTAHVVFTDIDAHEPASTSATVTREIIREEIGFGGVLMSDDLSMKALSGTIRERAEAVIRAGSDVALHCNGELGEMEQAAAGVPALAGAAARRAESALMLLQNRKSLDLASAEAALAAVIESHTRASESV